MGTAGDDDCMGGIGHIKQSEVESYQREILRKKERNTLVSKRKKVRQHAFDQVKKEKRKKSF